ncbi:MAG: hypothetical protein M3R09_02310 [Actinomycetota bacterium]|jgi:plasmid stability protein|nr:hypothetical protein [Actinomycetota bacterium]
MIQLRNVPDATHRELKVRAARAGLSLSDYLLRTVTRSVQRPPVEELWERARRRDVSRLTQTPAEALRQEREATA